MTGQEEIETAYESLKVIYANINVCVYIYTHIGTCTHIYVCTRTHIHTHTRMQESSLIVKCKYDDMYMR